jgi:hypothetical protein
VSQDPSAPATLDGAGSPSGRRTESKSQTEHTARSATRSQTEQRSRRASQPGARRASHRDSGSDTGSDSDRGSAAGAQKNELPEDRFDRLPKRPRVGAHRVVGRPRRFWIYVVTALLGVAVLTTGGILAVQFIGADVSSFVREDEVREPVAPVVQPELDPTAEVVVLNGTRMPGFGSIIDGIITENSWGQILFSTNAAANDIEISAVFYSSVGDEAAALGLAKELGGVSVYQSYDYTEFGARLVVLLGADYGGPGSELFAPEDVADDPAAEDAASDGAGESAHDEAVEG